LSKQRNPKGNYNLWCWAACGNKQVGPILMELLPHLVVKKENALNVLSFLETFKPRHRHTPITLEDKAERESYWLKAKALNRPVAATTERDAPVMGCDSLNSQETVRGVVEAPLPPRRVC